MKFMLSLYLSSFSYILEFMFDDKTMILDCSPGGQSYPQPTLPPPDRVGVFIGRVRDKWRGELFCNFFFINLDQ